MIKLRITGLVAGFFLVSFGPPLWAQTLSTTDITTTTTKPTTTKTTTTTKITTITTLDSNVIAPIDSGIVVKPVKEKSSDFIAPGKNFGLLGQNPRGKTSSDLNTLFISNPELRRLLIPKEPHPKERLPASSNEGKIFPVHPPLNMSVQEFMKMKTILNRRSLKVE